MEIPDGGNIYYYTPSGTNMTGEMLTAAQEESPLVLTGTYSDEGVLSYSLKLTREGTLSDEGEKIYTASAKAETLQESFAAEYTFGEDTTQTVAGKEAVVLAGDSLKNPDYAAKISILEDDEYVYTATIIYRKTEDGQYLDEAEAQLGTMRLGAETAATPEATPEPTPSPEPTPEATPSPEPTQEVTASTVPLETAAPARQADEEELLQSPMFLFLMASMIAIVILVILLMAKHGKSRRNPMHEDKDTEETPGYEERVGRSGKLIRITGRRPGQIEWKEPTMTVLSEVEKARGKEEPGRKDGYRIAAALEEPVPQKIQPVQILGNGQKDESEPKQAMKSPEGEQKGLHMGNHQTTAEGSEAEAKLIRGFDLKAKKDYIYAAKQFRECAKNMQDKTLAKTADMQAVECLTLAKQFDAALVLAVKVFYRDYDFSLEEREKLKSMIVILKKTNRRK